MSQDTSVLVIGPMPPPVHGMSRITSLVVEALRSRCKLSVVDMSSVSLERDLRYHVVKMAKWLRALPLIALHAATRDPRLYISANAGLGVYYTITLVTFARVLGYRIFIHHHSFAYIDRRTRSMAALASLAGPAAVHICLCRDMERRYREFYRVARCSLTLSNAWNIEPVSTLPDRSNDEITLGHLSNLGPEKGLDDVLETLRQLRRRGVPARLVLAGPPATNAAAAVIDAAISEFGDLLEYRGAVYNTDKDRFYRDVDIFLFPTRDEAEGIVLLEAMSYGVPPISYAPGCAARNLDQGGGVAVPLGQEFAAAALPVIIRWEGDRDQLQAARKQALTRIKQLKRAAEDEFKKFIEILSR